MGASVDGAAPDRQPTGTWWDAEAGPPLRHL